MSLSVRRWAGAASSAVIALTFTACGAAGSGDTPSDTTVPQAATDGATWLAGQLENGVLVNHQYKSNDDSTTVELAYALRDVDPQSPALAQVGAALATGAKAYSRPGKDEYSGATAKLLSFATDTGADPRSFGGLDLVKQMESLTAPTGRIADVSSYGDYANVFGEIWAVRGLLNARSKKAPAAEKFLLDQQCSAGYFRQDFAKPNAPVQGCHAGDPASVDTTALAVVLLQDKAANDQVLAGALQHAAGWLTSVQGKDGSFVANIGGGQSGPNADSTGLSAAALRLAGMDAEAASAATWVRAHQVPSGCAGKLSDAAGAIAYDDATLTGAAASGITAKTAFTWRLASAQALPALLSVPASAPAAACPTEK
ncbi:hypothetical protein GCM10028801_37500 [Nocardioides maradonensis]